MSEPIVTNAADQVQLKEAKKKLYVRSLNEREELTALLNQKTFRKYIWGILGYCGVFESVFGSTEQIFHNSGKQDVGHKIMADITNANPQAFIQMMIENKETE